MTKNNEYDHDDNTEFELSVKVIEFSFYF